MTDDTVILVICPFQDLTARSDRTCQIQAFIITKRQGLSVFIRLQDKTAVFVIFAFPTEPFRIDNEFQFLIFIVMLVGDTTVGIHYFIDKIVCCVVIFSYRTLPLRVRVKPLPYSMKYSWMPPSPHVWMHRASVPHISNGSSCHFGWSA